MRRRSVAVVAGAGTIAAIFVASFAVNAYAASNLQFRAVGGRDFDLASLSSGVLVEACNPTAFPVSFDEYRIDVFYRGDELATMSVSGRTIMPNTSERLEGSIDIDGRTTATIVAQALASAFSDQKPIDSQMTAKSTVESRVLGIIPVSDTRELDLDKRADTPFSEEYSCD